MGKQDFDDDPFFAFRDLELEVERKLTSLFQPVAVVWEPALARLEPFLSSDEVTEVVNLQHVLARAATISDGDYQTHTIRVTVAHTRALTRNPTSEDVKMGLCHNIFENYPTAADQIAESFLTDGSRQNIRLLTIDRRRERDPRYLNSYYDEIALASKELLLFKAVDKIDNFLSYVMEDLDPYYGQVVTEYLCPRLRHVAPDVTEYLERLVDYVSSPEVIARHSGARSDTSVEEGRYET